MAPIGIYTICLTSPVLHGYDQSACLTSLYSPYFALYALTNRTICHEGDMSTCLARKSEDHSQPASAPGQNGRNYGNISAGC